ncbi:MAG: cadmium-translocating P-type ATPase, partial [Candidatus Cloacimonetes bacterium]|nr:cadmium-translocating P-type ATPase [Candidatus Cloacimonadota bacterium]
GRLEIKVTSSEAESTVTRILNLIENAGTRKSQQEKFITRIARIYTPVVVGIAILVFLIPTILGHPAAVWFRRSLVFLIVSCPCALVISIPLSYYIGIGVAAKKGIIFKGSEYLDVLHRVKTVVFDKTGTLTTGEMKVEKVFVREGSEPVELMHSLWLAEHSSSHPFAKAIRSAYEGDFDPALVNAYSEYPGRGVLLQYGQDRLLAGSEAFLKEFGFIDPIPAKSHSAVHAAKNDFYLGCVTFSDTLKPGIKDTLAQLKTQGVEHTVMLSGDRREKAEKVSRETGLDEFHAELLPSHKLERLEEIMAREQGKTAFVGDGMNDAPALARADAGIAMGAIGNQASVETADIVLLNDKPEQLAAAFSISRRTGMLVAQNIAIALGVKALVMVLGVGGISGLWEAIIADVGVTLIVIFNSLRLLRSERRA